MNSNTWKHYYQSLATNEDGNKNLTAFAKDTDSAELTDFPTEILRHFHSDPNTVIMGRSNICTDIVFYHSIRNLGGSRARPDNKIVGLTGSGPEAFPLQFSEASITKEIKVNCPSIATLKGISDKAAVTTAVVPPHRPLILNNANFQFLPPFISSALLELTERDPAQILVEINSLIAAHDTAHDGDADFPKADIQCRNMRAFLWAVATDNIEGLKCSSNPDDTELANFSKTRHADCILSISSAPPSSTTNTDAIQQLAVSVQNQTDLIEELKQSRTEASKEKKQKFADLHESAQRLVLNASSQNGEVTPANPSTNCITFYSKSSAAKAANYLTSTLQDTYKCTPDLQTGFTQALFDGHFLRDREDSPSNFSFFLCPRKNPLSSGNRKRNTILMIKTKQGKGWSEQDYDDAVKQGISTPDDINLANHQFRIWWGCAAFFFGDSSKLPSALAHLINLMAMHCITFESQQLKDKDFFTKFGYQVDTRVFRWLQQCAQATDREQVDDSLLEFKELVNQVLNDQFQQVLPPTFKSNNHETDLDLTSGSGQVRKKQKKETNQIESRQVKNTGTISNWVPSTEVYATKFAGKHIMARPTLNGVPMCQRFHSKTYCFTDCNNKASHIPSNTLPNDIKEQYTKYCELCTE